MWKAISKAERREGSNELTPWVDRMIKYILGERRVWEIVAKLQLALESVQRLRTMPDIASMDTAVGAGSNQTAMSDWSCFVTVH